MHFLRRDGVQRVLGVGVVVPAGVDEFDVRIRYLCSGHLMVGIANALEVAPFAGHGFDGVFVDADNGNSFAVNLYQFNVRDNAGAGDLFALVDPALNRFGLHRDTHNLPCIADAYQHGAALGVGKRGECLNHFFLKAALEFDSRTFALADRIQQRGGGKPGSKCLSHACKILHS